MWGVDAAHLALVGLAAAAGGVVNAIAGGGSLITFPALVACGVPALAASAMNTVAMCPGYFGATVAQRHELAGQGARASKIVPLAALGGGLGAWLLLHTGERAFDVVVPFLLVFAVALLAFQDQIRVRFGLGARAAAGGSDTIAAVVVGVAAIYGGYFGAGLGVVVLAALAVITGDSIVKLNALKQAISLAVNGAAAVLFFVLADLDLVIVGVMAAGSLVGGFAGGRLASRVSPRLLRGLVVVIGLAVAAYYFAKLA
jgi:hypothetical protein